MRQAKLRTNRVTLEFNYSPTPTSIDKKVPLEDDLLLYL
jgi:hypothetical protein